MPTKKPQTIIYQRKRKGKTNYKKRLHLLLAKKPRLVVRLTNKKIIVQIIGFDPKGDKIFVGADSPALKKYGWNLSFKNIPSAYLTGYLIGKKALQQKIPEAILDIGFKQPLKGSRIYATLKGALDAGVKIPHSEEIFPSPERISGKHIKDNLTEIFEKTKKQIEDQIK